HPDFDVAYIRAAGTIESGGVPGNWDEKILLEGLRKSKLKSRLLFHLAANNLFQGYETETFFYSIQAINSITNLPTGAGPHIYIYYYLFYFFKQFEFSANKVSPSELIAMNSLGFEILSEENSQIKQVAAYYTEFMSAGLLGAAEEIIRSKFKEKEQQYEFPLYFQ
ncbi:MAG: hypothetical protein U9N32_09640, partial [Spirochaetota bacterium]|nr:hypothetical protein [Spirochaetota bacterium]